MPETPPAAATPATDEDLIQNLAFALRYNGRRRVHDSDDVMARIAAERLVRHLRQSGFIVMKGPPAPAPTTSHMPLPPGRT